MTAPFLYAGQWRLVDGETIPATDPSSGLNTLFVHLVAADDDNTTVMVPTHWLKEVRE